MATTLPSLPRYESLDLMRGIAVMAMLLMNVFYFAMPSAAYFNPRAFGGMDTPNLIAWALSFLFIEDKMRGLFSLLFGAGALLVMQRATAKGGGALKVHYSRMAWLLLFGLAHSILVANNDILRLYAAAGMILPWLTRLGASAMLALSACLALLHCAIGGLIAWRWLGWDRFVRATPGADPALIAGPERAFGFSPESIEAQRQLYLGDYGGLIASRIDHPLGLATALLGLLPQTLALMLIGMAMLKSGFITGEWERARYARLALWMFALSLPPLIMLCIWDFASGFSAIVVGGTAIVWSLPFDMLMTAGWAALIMWLVTGASLAGAKLRIAAVGRMAFTNYVLSGVFFGLVFWGYGFRLYGSLGRAETYLPVLLFWAMMLIWSKPWLDRYRFGPVEWLWRSAARWRWQKLRHLPLP